MSESMSENLYAIALPRGGYIDRGGRRTYSVAQMRFWKNREDAQMFIDREYFVVDWQKGEKHIDATIVPVTITIGKQT